MAVTVLGLDPANSPVQVTISHPDGSPLDTGAILDVEGLGLTAGGGAYFDTAGAAAGETAQLRFDGRWFLRIWEEA